MAKSPFQLLYPTASPVCPGCLEPYHAGHICFGKHDPLEGANCSICDATADNFYVSDDLWECVGLGHVQACFKCFRIAAWHAGIRPDPGWRVSL